MLIYCPQRIIGHFAQEVMGVQRGKDPSGRTRTSRLPAPPLHPHTQRPDGVHGFTLTWSKLNSSWNEQAADNFVRSLLSHPRYGEPLRVAASINKDNTIASGQDLVNKIYAGFWIHAEYLCTKYKQQQKDEATREKDRIAENRRKRKETVSRATGSESESVTDCCASFARE